MPLQMEDFMRDYVIISDATCDLSQEYVDKNNIEIIGMNVYMGDQSFVHYLDFRNMNIEDFYHHLNNGVVATTSQVNALTYEEKFSKYLKEGKDVLYICFSSGLSGTYEACLLCANMLNEKYENKVYVVDSLAASSGEGLLVMGACNNKQKGLTIEENVQWLEENKLRIAHWFTVDDLMYLKRGGRLNTTSAIVGSALKIKPILHVDDEGHLVNVAKAHGRKSSIKMLFDKFDSSFIDNDLPVIITHGNCIDDALILKEMVNNKYPDKEVLINDMGFVIASHTGPNILVILFYSTGR